MGNDGQIYTIAVTKSGVHRWTRVSTKPGAKQPPKTNTLVQTSLSPGQGKGRVVTAVDNGGSPFKVRLSNLSKPGRADVYVQRDPTGDDENPYTYLLWKSFDYEQVFVGLDPDEHRKKGGFWGKVWWHGGNSLLLQLRQQTTIGAGNPVYVFIGWKIYSFVPPDKILKYVSPMGNSAVPYPYAVGQTNTYLMIADTYIPNSLLKAFDHPPEHDPYTVYYQSDIQTGLPWTSMRESNKKMRLWEASHKLKGQKVLHKRLD